MRWLDGITDSMDMNLSKLWETVGYKEDWHTTVHEITKLLDTTLKLNNNRDPNQSGLSLGVRTQKKIT